MSAFSVKLFDYLVVGGGLAGLVVATRLSEDPSVSVGVIEAGEETVIPDVLVPGFLTKSLGNPARDWGFMSTPIKSADGQLLYMPRGKGLGGSSMLNFMVLARGSSGDYDAFEKLGNKNWNWKEFLKYFKKSETFTPPPQAIAEEYHFDTTVDTEYHGTKGPLSKTLPRWVPDLHPHLVEAFEASGVAYNRDPGNGYNVGISVHPVAITPETTTRSFSATAYYEPHKTRSNLHVITCAHVTRVLLSSDGGGPVIATGVEFLKGGETFTARAQKEVILSAGAFQSPQILELSGIGNPEILVQHGISPVVDLPGVGNNLQDHPWVPVIFETTGPYESMEALMKPDVAAKQFQLYEREKRGPFSAPHAGLAFLPLQSIMDKETSETLTRTLAEKTTVAVGGFREQLKLQREWLTDPACAQIEMAQTMAFFVPFGHEVKPKPDTNYCTLFSTVLHPVSRGSVHIKSSDPLDQPAIDVAFFESEVDLEILIHGLKFSRKVAAANPICSALSKEVYPGPDVQTDEQLKAYARKCVGTLFHPLGTAAMMPREYQGVVSPELLVYGTKNLRVVDASIIPLQLGAHTQSTVYAIAEKAADLIKGLHTASQI